MELSYFMTDIALRLNEKLQIQRLLDHIQFLLLTFLYDVYLQRFLIPGPKPIGLLLLLLLSSSSDKHNLVTIVVVLLLLLLLLYLCCCCCCSFHSCCCAWPADPQLGHRASQPWRLTSRPQGILAKPLNQPATFKGKGNENCPFLPSR